MIAFLIALGTTLLWYFFDRPEAKNQSEKKPTDYYQGVIRNDSIDVYKQEFCKKQTDEGMLQVPFYRVYFSTPGRSYMRFMREGRILNSNKLWPYPPNTP